MGTHRTVPGAVRSIGALHVTCAGAWEDVKQRSRGGSCWSAVVESPDSGASLLGSISGSAAHSGLLVCCKVGVIVRLVELQ